MAIRTRRIGARGVSGDTGASWAAQGLNSSINLKSMARFQQRQLMEKEQKLLQLYDQQQQRAHQVAQRGSAGSTASNGSSSANTSTNNSTTKTNNNSTNSQGGKVRQMFDERRQTTVKGIDRSYPLEPLENKPRKNNTGPQRNGGTITNRQSVTVKRTTIRSDKNGNINNVKPVVNYHEEVTSETFGPKLIHREEDLEEFYENDLNKWTNKNADKHFDESNDDISVNNQEKRVDRFRYENKKKEVSGSNKKSESLSSSGSRIEKSSTPDSTQSIDVVDGDNERKFDTKENTKKNSAFVIDLDNSKCTKKASNDKSPEKISPESRQKVSGRPASAVSTNSNCSSQSSSSSAAKSRMATKTRGVTSANRTSINPKSAINTSNTDSNLPACKICSRKFASDRIVLHEQICSKTSQKKRKTFDPVVQRVKGTELEPFVRKISKKGTDKKAKKPEVKSNWRRKHEDFINAIRSAKQMQAHLAAGGKLSDLPPPPASDTSDYIQCPHCNRKFNQGAAERHIPKCETMLHNKPNPRAPARQKR